MAGAPRLSFSHPGKVDYRIYPALRDVPQEILDCPELVVEKFLPEREGDHYVLREWYFLGGSEFHGCEVSDDPIFTSGNFAPEKVSPPPAMIRAARDRWGLDYGKIDYAIHEGEPVLFDINKATGLTDSNSVVAKAVTNRLAKGIYTYFPEMRPTHAATQTGRAQASRKPSLS